MTQKRILYSDFSKLCLDFLLDLNSMPLILPGFKLFKEALVFLDLNKLLSHLEKFRFARI
jgi:hypothetical protein